MRRLSHTGRKTRPDAPATNARASKARTRAVAKRAPRLRAPRVAAERVGAAIERIARALDHARVHFGHGTDNARDEAAELVFYAAAIAHDRGSGAYTETLSAVQRLRIESLLRRRIKRRLPLPYLTHRAFFAGLELYVDERVLIPRSPIAELILNRFAPWAKARGVSRILDMGTGSGAIALACAKAFPRATVDAVDISSDALAVSRRNARRLGLAGRVKFRKSDHFAALPSCRYDIIVSNPPYVGCEEMRGLPREYRHEPRLALASANDGLDSVRAILEAAPSFLADDGILVVEVGNTEELLVRKFPRVPFIWPQIAMGGGGVFVLRATDLRS